MNWAPVVETMRVKIVEYECDSCGARSWAKIFWTHYTADKAASYGEDWLQDHEGEWHRS